MPNIHRATIVPSLAVSGCNSAVITSLGASQALPPLSLAKYMSPTYHAKYQRGPFPLALRQPIPTNVDRPLNETPIQAAQDASYQVLDLTFDISAGGPSAVDGSSQRALHSPLLCICSSLVKRGSVDVRDFGRWYRKVPRTNLCHPPVRQPEELSGSAEAPA